MKRKRIDNRFLLENHRDVINNKILPRLNIKDLLNVCLVCKSWNSFVLVFMKRRFKSNIFLDEPFRGKTRDMLFHFMGVGGRSWIRTNNGKYVIVNTRATFTVCGLQPGINVFYGLRKKGLPRPRLVRLDKYEQCTIPLKHIINIWRKQGYENDRATLYIEATLKHMQHCIQIPVIIPTVKAGYYLATKNNKTII